MITSADVAKVLDFGLARNDLATMESDLGSMWAMLNGMLARDAEDPLVLPQGPPTPRSVSVDDARLIAVAVV